jgi:hypothetical protein
MLPNEDIIPIAYFGGTGGYFLCHLIVSAKTNSNSLLRLSKYGNAHNGLLDLPEDSLELDKILDIPELDKIKMISELSIAEGAIKPYYYPVHIFDLALISNYFAKAITITFDTDDIDELSCVYLGKWYVDASRQYTDASNLSENKSIFKSWFYKQLREYPNKQSFQNILCVSWKELFKGNIDELITKLSIFTNIDSQQFSKETMINWRDKTQYCIDTFIEK